MLLSHIKINFEIDYKSKEMANKEKDEVNKDKYEADKGHKSDIKATTKAAIERPYNRRLRDNGGKMLKL